MKQINLIPAEDRYVFPIKLILLGLLLMLLIVIAFQEINSSYQTLTELKAEFSLLELQSSDSSYRQMLEYSQLDQQVTRLNMAKEQLELEKRQHWVDLITLTAVAEENQNISIGLVEISKSNNKFFGIQLTASSLEAGAAFLEQVQQLNRYSHVVLLKGDQRGIDANYYLDMLVFLEEQL